MPTHRWLANSLMSLTFPWIQRTTCILPRAHTHVYLSYTHLKHIHHTQKHISFSYIHYKTHTYIHHITHTMHITHRQSRSFFLRKSSLDTIADMLRGVGVSPKPRRADNETKPPPSSPLLLFILIPTPYFSLFSSLLCFLLKLKNASIAPIVLMRVLESRIGPHVERHQRLSQILLLHYLFCLFIVSFFFLFILLFSCSESLSYAALFSVYLEHSQVSTPLFLPLLFLQLIFSPVCTDLFFLRGSMYIPKNWFFFLAFLGHIFQAWNTHRCSGNA